MVVYLSTRTDAGYKYIYSLAEAGVGVNNEIFVHAAVEFSQLTLHP